MSRADALAWIRRVRVVPVVRASSADEARRAVEALIAGGISTVEVTMTVPGAVGVIRELAQAYGDQALVGAGTVLDPETAAACVEAGARFVVSPALNLETVRRCVELGVAVAPGALTPTEVLTAHQAGADLVKVFPCGAVGGASYVRALKGPFPQIPLIPTGGVTLDNAREYLTAGADAVGLGSDLVDLKLLREKGPEELTRRAESLLQSLT